MTVQTESIHLEPAYTTSPEREDSTHLDEILVRRLQRGDLNALGDLYDRYKSRTYQTALALTHDPAAADDILQECFLRLHRYAHSIDPTRPFGPWLYRVTVNLSYTWVKKMKRWFFPIQPTIQLSSHPDNNPDKQAERNEVQDEVIHALANMKIQHRTVIVLYYLNSLSTEEIAEILECPIGTVKSRLFYGREKLRSKLSESWSIPGELKCTFA